MEVSPGDIPLPNPRRALKRSASTASLPTPPRTHRRHKRGRSRGDCDSESDNDAVFENQGSALLSSDDDEQGDELPRLDQRSRKKRRLSHSKGEDGDEKAFWLAGPDSESLRQKGKDRQGYQSETEKEDNEDESSAAPLLYRKSLKRTLSEASNGLASPPPSHRKPQTQAPITPPAATPGPSASSTLPKTQPASPPKTPQKKRADLRKGLKSPEFPIISDSPDNPFYVVPGSPSPGEESESPRVDSVSPRTPTPAHLEKPTVTYVFRGVRREYQNPLYNHRENRPLSPPPQSLLPIEHPEYSPPVGCQPTVLFPGAPKAKRHIKRASVDGVGSSTALRRSPRRMQNKAATVVDSDDELGDDDEKTMVKPRKLNFGAPKNAPGKKTKAGARHNDIV
ncbi:hypothetical protein NP233_g3963 [Leucocoprinus birnbaumii]|uniref:Uncharacterized protein n=1 Tax=Leucocoprinus birnbaumii TaxID=56174 RepID=A0AAD5VVM2_9AGAR|nr:hypothetical protein NP233_g3963 [Leucocoprinus birnbaumii]